MKGCQRYRITGHRAEEATVVRLVFPVHIERRSDLGEHKTHAVKKLCSANLENAGAMGLNDIAARVRPRCAGYDDASCLHGTAEQRGRRE